jgi:hypothetical protein
MAEAEAFAEAARIVEQFMEDGTDLGDAYVTLCVHAGIAAADAICMKALGRHHRGESHAGAIKPLARVDGPMSKHLSILLGMKTHAGYSEIPVGARERVRAGRAMNALLEYARR